MRVPPGQWRDPAAYHAIAAGGRAALAWELLRRRTDYSSPSSAGAGHDIVLAAPEVAIARWGLHFLARSRARQPVLQADLG